jgi:hypothetical protein
MSIGTIIERGGRLIVGRIHTQALIALVVISLQSYTTALLVS